MRATAHKHCKTCKWLAHKAEWLAHQCGQTSHTSPPGESEHWGRYVASVGLTPTNPEKETPNV